MQPYPILKAIITAGALAVAAMHIFVPSVKIDGITVLLLAAAALPGLQPIFRSVKLPGGVEIVLQELKQEIEDASGAAQSAQRKADLAVSGITALEDTPFGQYWGLQAVGRNLGARTGDRTSKDLYRDLTAFADRIPRGSDRDYEVRKIITQMRPSA